LDKNVWVCGRCPLTILTVPTDIFDVPRVPTCPLPTSDPPLPIDSLSYTEYLSRAIRNYASLPPPPTFDAFHADSFLFERFSLFFDSCASSAFSGSLAFFITPPTAFPFFPLKWAISLSSVLLFSFRFFSLKMLTVSFPHFGCFIRAPGGTDFPWLSFFHPLSKRSRLFPIGPITFFFFPPDDCFVRSSFPRDPPQIRVLTRMAPPLPPFGYLIV